MEENIIIRYKTDDGQTKLDVCLDDDTVWLTHVQIKAMPCSNMSSCNII